jgi:enamine deaminase RidA (YjgF/YER057c/UK114 family)
MMAQFEDKLKQMNLVIPRIPPAAGTYIPALRVGNLVFCSGQGPYQDGKQAFIGKVGDQVSLDEAYEAARIAGLNCLAEICFVIGSIDKIKRIVQVRGFVNCADDFHDQPKVINGTSDLLLALFGEAGQHVRCALGTNNLPQNIPVEVEMIVEVQD